MRGSSTRTLARLHLAAGRLAAGAVTEAPLLHGGLLPEPLLAGPAVLDVLQHVAKHGPLPALVLPRPLHPLVHFGTWGGGVGGSRQTRWGYADQQTSRLRQQNHSWLASVLEKQLKFQNKFSASFPFACHSSIERQNHCDPHMKVPRTCFAVLPPLLDVITKRQSQKKKKKRLRRFTKSGHENIFGENFKQRDFLLSRGVKRSDETHCRKT